MATSKTSNNVPPQRQFVSEVVFDWNILQYWMSDKMFNAIEPVLLEMDGANLQFVMSEISIYEAQCRIPVGKNTEAHEFLLGVPRYPIDANTHLIMGAISSCYKNHEKTKPHSSSISLPDVINASCAIQNNALLVTADFEDYPLPFFDPVYAWTINGEKGEPIKICLLQADVPQFDYLINKWVKQAEMAKKKDKTQIAKRGK
jgi:predicted nucleic acid-binding protein